MPLVAGGAGEPVPTGTATLPLSSGVSGVSGVSEVSGVSSPGVPVVMGTEVETTGALVDSTSE